MPQKKNLFVDCDPGIDDALAIMLALGSKQVELKGITAVFGNADIDNTYNNILKVLSLSKVKKLPLVGRGAENSLSGRLYKPRFVHGVDGLGNTDVRLPEITIKKQQATEVIKETFAGEDIDILLTLGPLTNIAKVLIEEPQVKKDIKQIILMGGAVFALGNATEDAEFNIYQDPEAAKVVLNSKIPIKIVSLDATRQILFTKKILKNIKYSDSKLSSFVRQIIEFALAYHKKYRKRDGIYLPDVLAMCVILNENIGHFKDLSLDVDLENTPGKTFVNLKADNNIQFLEKVNTDETVKTFIEGINSFI
jgi:inosine-uridine nucleoside N-ribohydrolase